MVSCQNDNRNGTGFYFHAVDCCILSMRTYAHQFPAGVVYHIGRLHSESASYHAAGSVSQSIGYSYPLASRLPIIKLLKVQCYRTNSLHAFYLFVLCRAIIQKVLSEHAEQKAIAVPNQYYLRMILISRD